MASAFRKISRVGGLTGGTRWYLSDDCLLAAKTVMYAVEYRRFYLRDLEAVVVWQSRLWPFRFVPGALLAALGGWLWQLPIYSTAGEIVGGIGLLWIALELALGPTANSHVHTTGAIVELPLVKRTRRAPKVLAEIDAAVRAARGVIESPAAPAVFTQPSEPSITPATETNAS